LPLQLKLPHFTIFNFKYFFSKTVLSQNVLEVIEMNEDLVGARMLAHLRGENDLLDERERIAERKRTDQLV
jgi:hypothetical protein